MVQKVCETWANFRNFYVKNALKIYYKEKKIYQVKNVEKQIIDVKILFKKNGKMEKVPLDIFRQEELSETVRSFSCQKSHKGSK